MKPTAAQAALGARRIQPKALSTGGVVFMVYLRNSYGLQCAWFIIIVPVMTTGARADGQPAARQRLSQAFLLVRRGGVVKE